MSINTAIGLAGVALQKDAKTPAEEPQFAHGLRGGAVLSVERSTDTTSVTCRSRADSGVYVDAIDTNPSYQMLGYSDVLPLYYLAALGEIVSTEYTTDTPDYDGPQLYKHVITGGQSSLPSLTVFGQVGADLASGGFGDTESCKVDTLSASFEGNAPIEYEVSWMGCGMQFLDEDPFEGCEVSCFDGSYVPTDGIFKIDTAGNKPEEAVITEGSIEVQNNCEAFRTLGQVMPSSIEEGSCAVSPSFTVIPDNIEPYRKMITGSATGKRPSGSIVYGSYFCEFRHSDNAEFTITYDAEKVPFTADFVEVDPEGGAGEFTFTADTSVVAAASGTPITITIINDTPGEKYLAAA